MGCWDAFRLRVGWLSDNVAVSSPTRGEVEPPPPPSAVRRLIDAAHPDCPGTIWHGHPIWSIGSDPGTNPVCLLKAYPSYITFDRLDAYVQDLRQARQEE